MLCFNQCKFNKGQCLSDYPYYSQKYVCKRVYLCEKTHFASKWQFLNIDWSWCYRNVSSVTTHVFPLNRMSFVKMSIFDDYKLKLHTEEVTQKLTEVNPMSFFVYKRKYVPKN